MNHVRSQLFASIALCLAAATATALASSEFERLLRNPKSFNGKRVTLVGLAEIGGSEFFVYPDILSAKRGENAVFIDAKTRDENPYEKFDKHWVKITGVVDLGIRPPLGGGECSILLERLEPLHRPPVLEDSVKAVFQNSTRETVHLKVPTPTGYGYAMRIAPGTATQPIRIAEGEISVTNDSGDTIAKGNLAPKRLRDQYFDFEKQTFYYLIKDGKISAVLPLDASNW
jgi:hypothetical protein